MSRPTGSSHYHANTLISSIAIASLLPGLVLGAAPGRALFFHSHHDHGFHAHVVHHGPDGIHSRHSHQTDGQEAPGDLESERASDAPTYVVCLSQNCHTARSPGGLALASVLSKCHVLSTPAASDAAECRAPPQPITACLHPAGSILSDASARLLLTNHALLL